MTIHHARPDALDRAGGLADEGEIYKFRALRPEFLNGAEDCRAAVLTPQNDLGLSPALRAAIARRVALTADDERLLAEYPVPEDEALATLSRGEMPEDDRLAAIAAHADMIAANPGASTRESLDALLEAGLSVSQVIALSELLAFACFQIRVAHGLSLLEEGA
ncbi:hypothetical protein K7H91_11260 [Martelella mediterranea]|uniref:hypothetical protein n=1 Tax=Martelella mediterranea TaxID=293089 RepID=UPI001E4885D7|nr:hypothetical protein [Martelella mediterranea]MCD1634350.1 hypothetical protein [Martelella mediterranea]